MKKFISFIFAMSLLLAITSCGSSKSVAYIQNSDSIAYDNSRFLYDAKIMPKDQLTVTVNTVNPEAS